MVLQAQAAASGTALLWDALSVEYSNIKYLKLGRYSRIITSPTAEEGTDAVKEVNVQESPGLQQAGIPSISGVIDKAMASRDALILGQAYQQLLELQLLASEAVYLQLCSIYSAENTVPIPFLRATDISPIALLSLLSDNMLGGSQSDSGSIAVEAIQELFTCEAQSEKGRNRQNEVPLRSSVFQRLTSSPTLMNLAQALAYHKMCFEDMLAAQEQQTVQNLSDTLRTILRL